MLKVSRQSNRRKRYKKLIGWLLADLTVVVIVLLLLLYRPGQYDPVKASSDSDRPSQGISYLAQLASQYYNAAQRRETFELVVRDQHINEALAESDWQMQSEGIWLSAPAVLFVPPGSIILMGKADVTGAEFIVTVTVEPRINQQGLLTLDVAKVKIGAMNLTPIAKMVAKKMYKDRLSIEEVDTRDWRTCLAAALLNDEPFVPIFPAEDKKVRLQKITMRQGELILRMVPAS